MAIKGCNTIASVAVLIASFQAFVFCWIEGGGGNNAMLRRTAICCPFVRSKARVQSGMSKCPFRLIIARGLFVVIINLNIFWFCFGFISGIKKYKITTHRLNRYLVFMSTFMHKRSKYERMNDGEAKCLLWRFFLAGCSSAAAKRDCIPSQRK